MDNWIPVVLLVHGLGDRRQGVGPSGYIRTATGDSGLDGGKDFWKNGGTMHGVRYRIPAAGSALRSHPCRAVRPGMVSIILLCTVES
jgi:hypothetical protein